MTTAHKIHAVFTVALILLLGAIGTFWVKDMIAKASAESALAAEKRVRGEVETTRQADLKPIQQDMHDTKTPAQAVKQFPKYLPGIKFYVPTIVTPPSDGTLPEAPQGKQYAVIGQGDVALPQEDAVPLVQFAGKCAESAVDLTACTKNLESANRDKKTLQDEVKGGTKWKRVLKAAECLGFSGAGAGLGALVSKHKPIGAVVGAGAGTIGCQLF